MLPPPFACAERMADGDGENKDNRKHEWKKAVKLLKSKDHNKRMEGLGKAEADYDFIREGGALPPPMLPTLVRWSAIWNREIVSLTKVRRVSSVRGTNGSDFCETKTKLSHIARHGWAVAFHA